MKRLFSAADNICIGKADMAEDNRWDTGEHCYSHSVCTDSDSRSDMAAEHCFDPVTAEAVSVQQMCRCIFLRQTDIFRIVYSMA